MRYVRACSSHECFIHRATGFFSKDTSWKGWNRHWLSTVVDAGFLSNNMEFLLTNVKWHSEAWPYTVTSSIDQTWYQYSWHHYWTWPFNRSQRCQLIICNGCGMQKGKLTPPNACSRLISGFPRTCRDFAELYTSNIPWYYLDYTIGYKINCICEVWNLKWVINYLCSVMEDQNFNKIIFKIMNTRHMSASMCRHWSKSETGRLKDRQTRQTNRNISGRVTPLCCFIRYIGFVVRIW